MIGISSCSSFKNSSYDDNDGIYSSSSSRETTLDENQTYTQVRQPSVYADKFKDMQDEFEETEEQSVFLGEPVKQVLVAARRGAQKRTDCVDVSHACGFFEAWCGVHQPA